MSVWVQESGISWVEEEREPSVCHVHLCQFIRSRDALNKSDFCDKRLKYKGFYRKNNLKSEFPQPSPEENFPQTDIGEVCPFSGKGALTAAFCGDFPTQAQKSACISTGNRIMLHDSEVL